MAYVFIEMHVNDEGMWYVTKEECLRYYKLSALVWVAASVSKLIITK